MSEKLSERLERFEFSDELGNGDFSIIREAIAIVRAVEDADQYVFGERSRNGCAVLVALPSWYGKRVKLVEAK